ncbi:MAG: hypothetical protein RIF41_06980 [Polyangiaceae bacterium]
MTVAAKLATCIFGASRIDYTIAVLARGRPLMFAVALVAGCDSSSPPGPAPPASASLPPLSTGTPVVAAVTTVTFRAGTVVRSDDQHVTVALTPGAAASSGPEGGHPTQTVARDAVWPITELDPREVTRRASKSGGEHGVCRIEITGRAGAEPAWHPCEVTGGAGGKLRVRDAFGNRHTVGPDEVVLPDAPARATIEAYLAREKRHREFDDAVEKAGQPYRPAGWDPAAGERVVVHFVGPSWYGGEILEHKRDKRKVRVRYDGGTWDDRDLSPTEVAPIPSTTLDVRVDGYALVRPDAPTKRWEPVRVKSTDGDTVVVTDRDDVEHRLPPASLLPLVAVEPRSDATEGR